MPAQTYINAINAVNSYNIANPNTPIHLVYQVSLCKSDATNQQGDGSNTCIDVEKSSSGWTSVNQIISGEISKLNTVITTVTPQVFSNAVSLIIVSNEDLIVSHGFDYSQGKFPIAYCNPSNSNQPCSSKAGYQAAEKFNDADITNELQQVQTILSGLNLPTIPPLSADLVVFNPTYADAATTTAFINVITNNNHTGPILMNIYPYQFNVGTDGQGAVNNLSQTNSLASLVNAMLNTSNPTIQGAIQSKGIMLGETGWPNNGTPTSGEYMTMNPGSVSATQNYINDVVAYANKNNIPILLFEAFDEPKKAGPSDPESHYGIYTWDNDPWINLNANGINISYAGKPGGVSPTHFDPKQFSIIAPASGVNGTVTVASSGMVIPFTGPNNAAVRLSTTGSDAITLAESCTNAQNAPSTINCLGTFTCTPKMGHNGVSVCTQGSAAFTSTTGFCSNSNGGISWDGAPVETGMLPTINLGIPNPTDAVNHCNGQTPTAGSMSVGISSGSSTGTYTVTQSSPTGSVVQSGSVSPGSSVIPGIAPGLYVSITINSCTAYSQLNAQGVWASQGTGNGCSTNWTNAGTSTNNATIWLP
ncbi:MAG: glycosyl hydrolase family 17 protein [Gammaproteobacteria bacterium]|nr:glycosyl hydrolase family 17 protein [Gammaproteobacteria bacterium]